MRQAMGDTLKILLLLCAVSWVISKAYGPTIKCSEGFYRLKKGCSPCKPCGNFMYEQFKCTETKNTVCGWCGRKPLWHQISDEVMASYQTKCLMSSLGFIGMRKLNDNLQSRPEDEPKLNVRVISVDDSKDDTVKDKFQIAKETLFNLDDSKEQELPDPTLEEGNDSSSGENDLKSGESSEYINPFEELRLRSRVIPPTQFDQYVRKSIMMKKARRFDSDPSVSVTEFINAPEDSNEIKQSDEGEIEVKSNENNSEEEIIEESVEPDNEEVSEAVKEFLVKKGKPKDGEAQEYKINPLLKDKTFVMQKDKKKAARKTSSEESNEREILWDSWVDDQVRPLPEGSIEIFEAQEITEEVYEAIPKQLEINAEKEIRELLENRANSLRSKVPTTPIIILTVGLVITLVFLFRLLISYLAMKTTKPFTGVPLDSPDYHMLVDANRHLEEMEKKNKKKASRHVHINPTFDV